MSRRDPHDIPLPDPPDCDGSGTVHECVRFVRTMDGPHADCRETDCPGCPQCRDGAAP